MCLVSRFFRIHFTNRNYMWFFFVDELLKFSFLGRCELISIGVKYVKIRFFLYCWKLLGIIIACACGDSWLRMFVWVFIILVYLLLIFLFYVFFLVNYFKLRYFLIRFICIYFVGGREAFFATSFRRRPFFGVPRTFISYEQSSGNLLFSSCACFKKSLISSRSLSV